MPAISAGLLLHHRRDGLLHVLLVHPGGPFWRRRDLGVWSIPKGEIDPGEDPGAAALREFEEELGIRPTGRPAWLGEVVQKGGKRVLAYTMEGDLDTAAVKSNTFQLEWPPRSGRQQRFPEIDRADWFQLSVAKNKILPSQGRLLDLLKEATD